MDIRINKLKNTKRKTETTTQGNWRNRSILVLLLYISQPARPFGGFWCKSLSIIWLVPVWHIQLALLMKICQCSLYRQFT